MSSVSSSLSTSNTASTDLTSSSTSTSTGNSATTFSGTSKFAADLQQAITRAVNIASLPIKQLNNQKTLLTEQQKAYTSLQGKFDDVSSAITTITSALGVSSYSASNSNSDTLTAALKNGALAGTYTIDVLTAGASTKALSKDGLNTVTDPAAQNLATGTSFTLSVGGVDTPITIGTSSLNSLAQAINTSGAAVQATIINIGSSSSPDYRLSLESTATDNVAIDLTSGGTSLLDVKTPGSQFTYTVNGQPAAGISTSSRDITISPNLTATLLAAGTSILVVGRDTTALDTAMTTLVSAYNSATTELAQYHGKDGGVLEGQREVQSLESSLRSLVNFTGGSGSVNSLFQMGLSFDKSGQLHFNSSAMDATDFSDLASFFGDGTQGGFIQNANTVLKGVDDPLSGILPSVLSSISTQLTNASDQIDENQQRVDSLQTSLTAKMAAADTAIAMLQDQADYFTNLFAAMKQDAASITNS